MNEPQARNYIANIFSRAFERIKFLELTRNLFNFNLDENKAAHWNKTYIKDAFKLHVEKYERLGTYTAPDNAKLDVLIVYLTKGVKLERARTALRNFAADHLKTRDEKDAALVAFVSPGENQWRFSYVKMEYSAIVTDAGKVAMQTELTPARRYSYLVGAGESCHTAQSRFIGLLQETRHAPTLAQIEEAFSVEAVTKEFFKQYAALFFNINAALEKLSTANKAIGDELTKQQISTVDFAKKLLGQIVFLYFLQKKGWLGAAHNQPWGSGAPDFLRRMAKGDYGNYKNLFNDLLEPLFYDTLATDRGPAAWCEKFNCRIPFLNGGLFEPLGNYNWRGVDVLLPNELFTNSERTAAGDTGTGVFDIFDRYNFTVNEAEPLEKEVAIDPEMLGKVFENLIEDNRRKGLGSFYTPREIVHYMCQESLINYLDTALNERVFPSPVGEGQGEGKISRADLETFVHLGEQISHYESVSTHYAGREMPAAIQHQARLIDDALAAITVCDPAVGSGAFPVGMMMEIVRVRSALTPYFAGTSPPNPLSLTGEGGQETPYLTPSPVKERGQGGEVSPRSSYLFKRHAIQNCLYGVDIDPGAVEIAKLRLWLSLVVDEEEIQQIKPLPNLDYKIVAGNSLLGVSKDLFNEQLFQQLENLKPRYFDETDKQKKDQYKQQIEAIIHQLTDGKAAFDFELYFSEVFQSKGGFDVVIGNPPWGSKLSTAEEKKYFRRIEKIEFSSGDSAELFAKKSFDKFVAENGFLTFIIPKKSLYGDAWDGFRVNYWKRYQLFFLLDASKAFENVLLEASAFGLKKKLGNEISTKCLFLAKQDTVFHFATGIKDQIFLANNTVQIYKLLYPEFLWIKIQKGSVKQKLVEGRLGLAIGTEFFSNVKTDEKLLKGIDITRWLVRNHRWLRNKSKLNWASAETFQKQKIISQVLVAHIENPTPHIKITACLDEEGIIITNTIIAFDLDPKIDQKFWLGYLNSNFVSWYAYNFIYSRAIRTMHLYNFYIQCLVIPRLIIIEPQKQIPIIKLVDQILAAKTQNAAADVRELEQEIDQLVYALYELTPDEIAIVEAAGK